MFRNSSSQYDETSECETCESSLWSGLLIQRKCLPIICLAFSKRKYVYIKRLQKDRLKRLVEDRKKQVDRKGTKTERK